MEIKELKNRTQFSNQHLSKVYKNFNEMIKELHNHSLNHKVVSVVNTQIDLLNKEYDEKQLRKLIRKGQHKIIQILATEHKIVPKGYYRNLWMAIGMSAFGISMGTAFGVALGNMGLMGAGIPIGMAMGIAIGTSMDQKAAKEGRQLQFDSAKK